MSNINIEEKEQIKRIEAIASKKSSIFGVSNRLILPLFLPAIFFSVNGSFFWGLLFISIVIIEIVLRYVIKLTITEMATVIWRAFFWKEKKCVKN